MNQNVWKYKKKTVAILWYNFMTIIDDNPQASKVHK